MDVSVSDSNILVSMVNMWLRDDYASLDDLCASRGVDRESLMKRLGDAGFVYDARENRFR